MRLEVRAPLLFSVGALVASENRKLGRKVEALRECRRRDDNLRAVGPFEHALGEIALEAKHGRIMRNGDGGSREQGMLEAAEFGPRARPSAPARPR